MDDFQTIVQLIESLPEPSSEMSHDVFIQVYAAKKNANDATIREAMRYLLVDHLAGMALRPLVLMILQGLHEQTRVSAGVP